VKTVEGLAKVSDAKAVQALQKVEFQIFKDRQLTTPS